VKELPLFCKNKTDISIPIFAIAFIALLGYEIINYYFSAYQANSILFLQDFLAVLFCIFVIYSLLASNKYKKYGIVFVNIPVGLLTFFNLPVFFFRYYEAGIYGFDDFSQFRFLYMPLGFLSNEWVTIMLCLLPFPIIGLFLFWKRAFVRYGFLLITGLLVFNIFISFSRAGILAFLLFVGLLNILFYFYRICSIKKLLLCNGILVVFFILFAFCFSESIQSSIYQTNSHQRSTEGRLRQWEAVSSLSNQYPFWGIGSKNYALLGRQSQEMNLENSFSGRVNNTYLQLIIEKGWIGALLWFGVIVMLTFRLFRQMNKEKDLSDKVIDCILFSAILAILFREIFFSSLLYNNGILLLFFILLIFNHKEDKPIKIPKLFFAVFIAIFSFGIIYFHLKKPDNALAYAIKGLEYERSTDIQLSYNQLETYSKTGNDTITKAIQQYKEACFLSPHDALFQHNLGWLYWMDNQPDSAIMYISQAIKTDPNTAIYRLSKGLILESQEPEQAFEQYKQAILLSPDITDSQFFKDFEKRNSIKAKEILQNAYEEILAIQSVRYSSIIEAKLGKILLSMGEIDRAYDILSQVVLIHPNLNRPWYYLGYMEQLKGSEKAIEDYYKKSLFLSPFDHLPLYAFASYYKEVGNDSRSDSYFKSAEKAWKNKRSVHSLRCKRMYYMDTEKDNVIPQGLLDYISPTFNLKIENVNLEYI